MGKLYLLLSLYLSVLSTLAQTPEPKNVAWPVPDVPNLLFYIQRDPDINTVVYTLNTTSDGRIDKKEPIKIFWIKYAEGGIRKPLNLIQKDLAYGLTVKEESDNIYNVKAVAYPKMVMHLKKEADSHRYQVRVRLDSRECTLKRIFIRIVGGSHLHPDVAYLEFHGTDVKNGTPVTEKIFPN